MTVVLKTVFKRDHLALMLKLCPSRILIKFPCNLSNDARDDKLVKIVLFVDFLALSLQELARESEEKDPGRAKQQQASGKDSCEMDII